LARTSEAVFRDRAKFDSEPPFVWLIAGRKKKSHRARNPGALVMRRGPAYLLT